MIPTTPLCKHPFDTVKTLRKVRIMVPGFSLIHKKEMKVFGFLLCCFFFFQIHQIQWLTLLLKNLINIAFPVRRKADMSCRREATLSIENLDSKTVTTILIGVYKCLSRALLTILRNNITNKKNLKSAIVELFGYC